MTDSTSDHYRQIAHDLIRDELRLTVISDSMQPLLRTGDVVVAEPLEPSAVQIGDVIVVRRGAELITHRLLAIDPQGWWLRGDDAIWSDETVRPEAVIGRVIFIERATHPIDLRQPIGLELNRRLTRINLATWRVAQHLGIDRRTAGRWPRWAAWMCALPGRVAARIIVANALKRI